MIEKIKKDKILKYSGWWKPKIQKFKKVESHSWFNIEEIKNSDAKTYSQKINTVNLRCEKIKINPSPNQQKILKDWLEIYRRVYNITIKFFKKNKISSKFNARKSIKPLIKNDENLQKLIEKSKIPVHTIDNAIFDVVKAYKTCFSNFKSLNINHFRLRYKKLNKPTKTLVLESCNFSENCKGLKKKELKNLKPSSLINTKHDVRLNYDGKTFILNIPGEKKCDKIFNRYDNCALDSGMRTFQTLYSPTGLCYKFCSDTSKLKTIIEKIDNVKKIENHNYNEYLNRLRTKLKNLINDLHWKTISFICKKFNTIFLGNLSTKNIVSNDRSNLNKTTKRICYLLSHFSFSQKLKSKCEELGCNFKLVDESYTSKTCGSCGEIKEDLGGLKIYDCSICKLEIDRDINGARNILIKNIN